MGAHVVTAPLVIVSDAEGKQTYLYTGALVPDFVTAERLEQLAADGVIADTAPAAEPDDTEKAPGKSASKATWVEYAVSQGMDATEAEALTRDDLAEKFGEPANSGS